MKNLYMAGEHVYLRHPTEEDALGKWHEWFSDEDTTKYNADQYWPNTVENQLALYKSLTDNSTSDSRNKLVLSVVTIKDDLHIGVVGLTRINWVHRYADIIIIIGDKDHRKMPYSLEAHELTHSVAFLRLNLLHLRSFYAATNEGAAALQNMLRYKKIGVYPEFMVIDGKWVDLVTGLLKKDDYLESRKL